MSVRGKPKLQAMTSIDPESFFVLIERIGKGSFGEVYKTLIKDSKESVAVKVIDLEQARDEIDEIQNEIFFLQNCNHPHVIGYYHSHNKGKKLWMVMELMVGSAQDLMKPKGLGPFSEEEACVIASQCLLGLVYLHNSGIVHRDLKAANVLISSSGDAMLADLGVAGILNKYKQTATSFAGTPHWIAPEMIRKEPYNQKVDVWSYGITVYELVNGEPPNSDLSPNKAMQMACNNPPAELSDKFSKNFRDFVAQCLIHDPAKRPTSEELLKHKFVKGAKKKKDFLQARIAEFLKWRTRGEGDSDSDDSSDSDNESNEEIIQWDFSDDPPTIQPKERPAEASNDTDWVARMKPATKAQRKATRTVRSKKKKY